MFTIIHNTIDFPRKLSIQQIQIKGGNCKVPFSHVTSLVLTMISLCLRPGSKEAPFSEEELIRRYFCNT